MLGARARRTVLVMRQNAFAFALFGFVSIVACAGPQDLASQAATLTDYCNARAKTECSQSLVKSCEVKDVDTCVTTRSTECAKDVPQGTTYVPAAGPACLQAVATAYTSATITAGALDAIDTACAAIFSGPGAARSPCTVDYDCASKEGLRCLIAMGDTQGKCLAPNLIDPGGTCPGEADVCSGPYYCDFKSKVCVAEGGEGSTCAPDIQPCIKGFKCPGSIFGGTCAPLKAAGDACIAATDCASSLCDKAIGQAQGVCADQIQLTALDSMCAEYQ